MKQTLKRILLAFSMTILICCLMSVNVFAAENSSASGEWGGNLTWEFDEVTGTMTIDGTGEMSDLFKPTRWAKMGIKSVVINEGITHIGNYSFWKCTTIEEIKLPGSLLSVGEYAFSECNSLKKVVIPDSVTSIGSDAFKNCTSLKELKFSNNLVTIGGGAIANCSSLEILELPNSVTEIGTGAFAGCKSLRTIDIPPNVSSIAMSTFARCDSLEEIVLPDGIIEIGPNAFADCINLKTINIPKGVTSLEYDVFENCQSLKEIEIHNSITSIGSRAFFGCCSLEEVTIPITVTSIDFDCFSNCDSLKQIFYDGDESDWIKSEIADSAIPEGVKIVYKVPTTGVCAAGHTVVYLEAVEETCSEDGITNGRYCSVCNTVFKAQEVIPATGNHNYSQGTCLTCGQTAPIDGKCGENLFWDYDRGGGTLRIAGKGEMFDYLDTPRPWSNVPSYLLKLAIKEGVTSIGSNAFAGSLFDHLDLVDLPKSLQRIGQGGLGGVYTSEFILRSDIYQSEEHRSEAGVNYIGILYAKDGVTSIPADIAGVSRYMELPVSLQTLYNFSYDNQVIYYKGTEEQWKQVKCYNMGEPIEYSCAAYSILGCARNGYVNQDGYMHLFSIGSNWHKKYMVNVTEATVGTPESVPSESQILNADSGFSGFGNMKRVTIYPCMKTIMESAFLNCHSLKEIYFAGTEEEWNKLLFRDGSNALRNVSVYYEHGEHTWEEIEVVKDATCTDEGEHTVACSSCGMTKTEPIPAIGHSYEKGICAVCNAEDPNYVDPSWPFADVRDRDWFIQPVLWAKDNNITGGISENKFGPNEGCTRAQVVTFLWAANGKPEPKSTNNPFKDVADDAWYLKPVLWAVEQGITGGVSKDKFGPEQTCTRGQIVTFLYAAEKKPTISGTSTFKDVADDAWFAKPVIWAAENDVTGGIGNGKFGPNDTCTRAQVVTFLYKVYGVK